MEQTPTTLDDRLARLERALGVAEPEPLSTEDRVAELEASRRRLRLALAAASLVAVTACVLAGLALARQPEQGLSKKQQIAEARVVLRSAGSISTLQATVNRVAAALAVDSLIGNGVKPASLSTPRGKTCLRWVLTGKGSPASCGFK